MKLRYNAVEMNQKELNKAQKKATVFGQEYILKQDFQKSIDKFKDDKKKLGQLQKKLDQGIIIIVKVKK